jgi:anti-anti-sigma factor
MTASLPRRRADGAIETGDGVQPVLDQKVDGGSLYQLRASAAARASQAGLSAQRADDLVIAVHELAANVVRHGSGRGRLRIWKHHQVVHCQVTDEGAAPDPGSDPLPWKVLPGHGLWLVRHLADRTNLHPGPNGTAVTISFRLGPADGLPFTLSRLPRGACTVLAVSGQLDLNSAGQFTEAVSAELARTSGPCLIIDLAGLVFWDVFGIAALLRAQAQADAMRPARLVLADVPGPMLQQLRDTGLGGRFTIANSADEAYGGVSPPP